MFVFNIKEPEFNLERTQPSTPQNLIQNVLKRIVFEKEVKRRNYAFKRHLLNIYLHFNILIHYTITEILNQ